MLKSPQNKVRFVGRKCPVFEVVVGTGSGSGLGTREPEGLEPSLPDSSKRPEDAERMGW